MKKIMKSGSPKVSVIIPLYNHEKYIGEAVDSVLNQTVQDFELIIINDGSVDNSGTVVEGYNDERIRYFVQDNQGAHHAINRGIECARGEYISILNSDDIYSLDRLDACIEILEKEPLISAVFSHMEWIDGSGGHIRYLNGVEDNWLNHHPDTSFKNENNILLDLLAGNFLMTTSNLFCRKKIFNEIEGFRNLRYVHDYDFFLRLCLCFKSHIIESPLLKYRMHRNNTINENKPETFFEWGLVYADLMLNHHLESVIPEGDNFDTLVKIFNSINPHFSERMLLTLLFYYMKEIGRKDFFAEITNNPENPFRKTCIEYVRIKFEDSILLSEHRNKIGQVENAMNDQKKLIAELNGELHSNRHDIRKYKEQVELYENSVSLKAGRALTWPVKKMVRMSRKFFLKKKDRPVHQPDSSHLKSEALNSRNTVLGNPQKAFKIYNDELLPEDLKEVYRELSVLYGGPVSHVFLVPWLVRGGADLETLNYINALAENNLAGGIVVIATENTPSPWEERLPEGVCFINWGEKYHYLTPEKQESLLKGLLLSKEPHAIHIVNSDLGYRVLEKEGDLLKKKSHLYACVFCEDITEEGEYVGYSVWYIPKIYDYLDALLCDNVCHLNKLQKEYSLESSKMFVNYHPADIEIENDKEVNVEIHKDNMHVLWAGRLGRQKRPDILLKIAEKCKTYPFTFHVYGSAVLEKDVYTERFREFENIIYHGGFDKGLSSIETERYDIFLYTSQWDGLPNILIEAMASGLPVISSDVGGIGELVIPEETGFLVTPYDDENRYVECLVEIYNKPSKINDIVKNAYALIRSRHSNNRFLEYVKNIPDYAIVE